MNDVSNPQSLTTQKKTINVGTAILIGQLIVNLPVLIIIFGVASVGIVITIFFGNAFSLLAAFIPFGAIASFILGVAAGWLWWSFSVPRWRRWAHQNGAPEDKLQKWAVITGLVWPKGWDMEKTEFRTKE